ncbi:partial Beta-monoglucosyldiacylglycerol synthase, partial [Anaerolineae bacterium]
MSVASVPSRRVFTVLNVSNIRKWSQGRNRRSLHPRSEFSIVSCPRTPSQPQVLVLSAVLITLTVMYAAGIAITALVALIARHRTGAGRRPFVSVVVAARNEEHNIGRCLESMSRLTWPRDQLEVIIVNDRSEDATPAIVREYAARFPFIALLSAAPGTGHLAGKTNAVTQGIDASKGEIIMMTDADCAVPPSWIEETVKYYTADGIGLVPGFTAIRARNLFEAIQTIDWFALFTVAS